MGIVSDKESRHLAQRTPYAAAILRLHDNSSLGRRSFEMPLKYFIQGTRSGGFISNCHGTTAYVTRVEDDIVLYWTPERSRRLNNDGTEYIALPRVELDRPGFVAPSFMGEFLENGGRFRRITGEPALGDIVTFQDSEQRLQHSAVFLGVLNGCNVVFHQHDNGEPFVFDTVENYKTGLEFNLELDCYFTFWRKSI